MRTQAIPLATYRRRQAWMRARYAVAALVLAVALYAVSAIIGDSSVRLARVAEQPLTAACTSADPMCGGIARPELVPEPPPARPRAVGLASTDGIGDVTLTNIDLAIALVDGTVVAPGASFSFDDTAKTWDFQEDDRYVWGLATSVRGPVWMRGGGVCWVSTAIWRAALEAGLPTGLRQAHLGLVTALGPGLDATNTLVVENDSTVPVKIRVWRDDDAVYAALFSDGSLGRKARVEGPIALGRGSYIAYQHVTWEDGTSHVSEFSSYYYW